MSKFVIWLNQQVDERGWTFNELGRRAGLSSGHISMVTTERQNPGYDFCIKVANALDEPPEKVLRIAGLLPPLPTGDNVTLQELSDVIRRLPRHKQRELLWYAMMLYQRKEDGQPGPGGD